MPMKVKDDDPEKPGEKPTPFRKLKTKQKKTAFVRTSSVNLVPDFAKTNSGVISNVVSIKSKQPKKAVVVGKVSCEVMKAANDSTPSRKAPEPDIEEGGGGLCQEQCPELEGWLADNNPVPNKFCLLKDKEIHIKRSESSANHRLALHGSTTHGVGRSRGPVVRLEGGWWDSRPPSVIQLVKMSLKISERLGPYHVDTDTLGYLRQNLGRRFKAPPTQDPNDMMRDQGLDIVCKAVKDKKFERVGALRDQRFRTDWMYDWDRYVALWPKVPFPAARARELEVTEGYLSEIRPGWIDAVRPEVKPEVGQEHLTDYCSFCTELTPMVRTKDGGYEATKPITVYQHSFKEERVLNKWRNKGDAPLWEDVIAYKDIEVEPYRADVSRANAVHWFQLHAMVEQTNRECAAEWDRQVYSDLSMYYPSSSSLAEESCEPVSHMMSPFMRLGRLEKIYSLRARIGGRFKQFEATIEAIADGTWMEKYFHNWWQRKVSDDESRLQYWLAQRRPPEPPKLHKLCSGMAQIRWNRYVQYFRAFERGEIVQSHLEAAALMLWQPSKYSRRLTRSSGKVDEVLATMTFVGPPAPSTLKAQAEWAELMMDFNEPLDSDEPFVVDRTELYNSLSFVDDEGNLIIDNDSGEIITGELAERSLRRLAVSNMDEPRYLALYKAFKRIGGRLSGKSTEPQRKAV